MKLSFSLGKAKASSASAVGQAPSFKKPAAFGSLDDEETTDAAPTASSSRTGSKPLAPATTGSWRGAKKKDVKLDATVAQYDEVYDDMKAAQEAAKAAAEDQGKEKKSKYMTNLLQSAETRKLDYVRAEEKLMQREREKEGDEFADKDKFVTPAYKAQMEEVRRAEEEEKKREEAERKKKKNQPGMAAFYKDFLQKTGEQHEAASIAAAKAAAAAANEAESGSQDLTIRKPLKVAPDPDSVFKEETDADRAALARAEGKDVELNDDGMLVDKRDLLSAGLNVNLSAPNTRKLGSGSKSASKQDDGLPPSAHRAAGSAATLKEIRARQARELERQYEEERVRVAQEKEKQEREELERVVKRKNTEADVQSARERYLDRKRRKLEEEGQRNPNAES
ncbi:hypothetical protein FRB90_011988 [Tulasnella sp. 427]|nr:hypothetical protein FRB90_011988 [Tulasnella sp. 427]